MCSATRGRGERPKRRNRGMLFERTSKVFDFRSWRERASDMTLHAFLFWTIAATTGFCAVAVVVSQNIVRAATWLLFTLAGASGVFFLLGADLVGAIQLLIYVGGTLILVVFGVMLTAQGPFITMKTSAVEWAMSGVVGLVLLSVLAATVLTVRQSAQHGEG